jgi:RNA recognition motif-containing protein
VSPSFSLQGFGFVNFEAPEEAASAVQALNGEHFHQSRLFQGFFACYLLW